MPYALWQLIGPAAGTDITRLSLRAVWCLAGPLIMLYGLCALVSGWNTRTHSTSARRASWLALAAIVPSMIASVMFDFASGVVLDQQTLVFGMFETPARIERISLEFAAGFSSTVAFAAFLVLTLLIRPPTISLWSIPLLAARATAAALALWHAAWLLSGDFAAVHIDAPLILLDINNPFWRAICMSLPLPFALFALGTICLRASSAAQVAAVHCVRCGYDLRATPSATCPECGNTRSAQTPISKHGE